VTQSPLLAAVIGSPVVHSLSPAMYRAVFEEQGMNGRYEAIECGPDQVGALIDDFVEHGVRGVSVTMPLKEAIIEHLDDISDTARLLNAVNCVVIDAGKTMGHNTDGDGCCEALVDQGGASLAGASCVVLGAGGTGRSVALAAGLRGAHVIVVNRTVSRTTEMISRMGASIEKSGGSIRAGSASDIESATIVVNTTSVGMNSDQTPVSLELFHSGQIVLDAVYQPMETALLAGARSRGAHVIDGLWMLVQQARRQCTLQFGCNPSADLMRQAAERELRARRQ